MERLHKAMVIAAVSGALLAAGANLWPTIAEAAQLSTGTAQSAAEQHAPNTAALDATAPRAPAAARNHTAAKPIAADTGPPLPAPRPDAAMRTRRLDAPDTGQRPRPDSPWRTGRWEGPVGSVDPATRFDPPPLPWLPGHRGVDFAAAADRAVTAVGPGTVVFAGTVAGRGVVSVDHPGGLRTTYEPVDPVVDESDAVAAGQTIGHLAAGHASCPAAACLHLGLKRGSAYLDPLLLFGWGQVRLLPRPTGEAP